MKGVTRGKREEWVRNAIATRIHPENFARNPQKFVRQFIREYAHREVMLALKRGELVKPAFCPACGCTPPTSRQMHAHHADYDRPLRVEWVCRDCHHAKHRGLSGR